MVNLGVSLESLALGERERLFKTDGRLGVEQVVVVVDEVDCVQEVGRLAIAEVRGGLHDIKTVNPRK